MGIREWFAQRPWLVPALGSTGAAVFGIKFQEAQSPIAAACWFIALVASIVVPAALTHRNRLGQTKRAAERAVRDLLATAAHSFGYPARHVRTNVMVFTNNGQRRRVQANTAFNMSGDADEDLEIHATAGVSGKAVVQRRPAFGNLRLALQNEGPDWGLQPSEKAKVRQSLQSILSVPILDPDDPKGQLLGTLQIDSDCTIEEMGFDQTERRELAERFADTVALLLKSEGGA
jgi:hypothetical protein